MEVRYPFEGGPLETPDPEPPTTTLSAKCQGVPVCARCERSAANSSFGAPLVLLTSTDTNIGALTEVCHSCFYLESIRNYLRDPSLPREEGADAEIALAEIYTHLHNSAIERAQTRHDAGVAAREEEEAQRPAA